MKLPKTTYFLFNLFKPTHFIALGIIVLFFILGSCESDTVEDSLPTQTIIKQDAASYTYRYPTVLEKQEVLSLFSKHLNQSGLGDLTDKINSNTMLVMVKSNEFLTFGAYIKIPNINSGFYNIAVRKSVSGAFGKPYFVSYSEDLLKNRNSTEEFSFTAKAQLVENTSFANTGNQFLSKGSHTCEDLKELTLSPKKSGTNDNNIDGDIPPELPNVSGGGVRVSGSGGWIEFCVTKVETVNYKCNGPDRDTPHPPGPGTPNDPRCGDPISGYSGSGTKAVGFIEKCYYQAISYEPDLATPENFLTDKERQELEKECGKLDGTPIVFPGNLLVSIIKDNSSVKLSEEQTAWLEAHPEVEERLLNYLTKAGVNAGTLRFVVAAIDAFIKDGEVDFENRLIYNPQIAQDYKERMSPAERKIYDNELTTIQKYLYLKSAVNAYIYAETYFPKPVRNRLGDAFKHTYWNALSTVRIGEVLTKKLTDAHEDIDYEIDYPNQYKETQMDLHNNAKGRQIAYGAGPIYQLVQQALDNGNLRYLNNLEWSDKYKSYIATNSSQLIPTSQ